jgi:hypothetical protein
VKEAAIKATATAKVLIEFFMAMYILCLVRHSGFFVSVYLKEHDKCKCYGRYYVLQST